MNTVYKTIVELDSAKERIDSLQKQIQIKDANFETRDKLLFSIEQDRRTLERIVGYDTLIIASWKDEAKNWERAHNKQKGLKIGSIVLGSISIALNIFLPIYFTLRP